MKKYIILSVNDNPDYLFHVPLTVWAWRKLGWDLILFYHRNTRPYKGAPEDNVHAGSRLAGLEQLTCDACADFECNLQVKFIDSVEGYKSETITQVSRLFGACAVPEGSYVMTSDIDMIPLSDYWKPDMETITVYGRDLTDYHYPICYVGMPDYRWEEIMDIGSRDYNAQIKRNLRQQKSMWVLDQDIITERINNSGYEPIRIDRGTDKRTGYPIGRIDRSHWTLDHKQYIDCHLFHGIQRDEEKFKKVLEMLDVVWPKEDWKWFINYYKEFKKLCQNK